MSQFNPTLGNTDLGYLLGTFHFHVSQNMEAFIKTVFSANKMVVLWIFLSVGQCQSLSVTFFEN